MNNGSLTYAAPLAQLPAGIVFPDAVTKKVSYDTTKHLLRFQGAMASTEQAALMGASSDAPYQAAVNDLYEQPIIFLNNALSGFLNVNDATTKLVRNVPALDQNLNPVQLDHLGNPTADPTQAVTTAIASKFAYLLGELLPYLTVQLSHALGKQTIADALRLDSTVTQLLLETLLRSQEGLSQPVIVDLLALSSGGLTANYYTSSNLSGVPSVPAAPVVPTGATIPAGIQSARWTGMLLAPNNGVYTFSIRTNGNANLWLGDQPLTAGTQAGEWTTPNALTAEQLYDLRLEIVNLPAQNAVAELAWQSAALPKADIPADNLYPQAQLNAFAATFTRMQKAALIVNTFKLNAGEVAYLADPKSVFQGLDLNALPFARDSSTAQSIDTAAPALFQTWRRVNDFVNLRNALPQGQVSLVDVFGTTSADPQSKLAQATGWDAQAIADLAGSSGFNLGAADFTNEAALLRLQACVALIKRLGVSAAKLFAWADLNADFPTLQGTVLADIKKTVQGKYDPATWLTVAKALNDPLRQARRDALVAYLLPVLNFTDADQLFEFFLIDAEMCACMEISRIKQAISSVQLFVQRCLLNLESTINPVGNQVGVAPDAISADLWQWMQQYTLWAANREVFLYAENWIESSLRDDKSPFFQELEAALLQNEVTNDNVEAAYVDYLHKLDQVARLEICGMYWQDVDPDTGAQVNTLHVFGRTRQPPHSYFYRRLLNNNVWTAWESVTVDIQGDHLIPVIWNRRPMLFWPTFTRTADAPGATSVSATKDNPINPPAQRLQIGLAWSEYRQNKWSPKQVTNQIQVLYGPTDDTKQDSTRQQHYGYVFATEVTTDANKHPSDLLIHVHCFAADPPPPPPPNTKIIHLNLAKPRDTFDIGGCTGDTVQIVHATPSYPWSTALLPTGTDFDAMMYAASQQHLGMVGQDGQTRITFLASGPSLYKILYPHHCGPYTLQLPFFYQDASRTFFATPSARWITVAIGDANSINIPQYTGLVSNQSSIHSLATSGANALSFNPAGVKVPAGGIRASARTTAVAASAASLSSTMTAPTTAGNSLPVTAAVFLAGTTPISATTNGILPASNWAVTTSAAKYQWSQTLASVTNLGWQALANGVDRWQIEKTTDLTFDNHYHPFVCEFMKALSRQGLPGLLTEGNQTLGNPYLHSPWQRASWGTTTAISEAAAGPACIIQGDFGVAGYPMNFEAVVLEGTKLVHYGRDNSDLSQPWKSAEVISTQATGPGWLFQSDWMDNRHGHLEVIVLEGKNLVHYWIDNTSSNRQWNKDPNPITANATGSGCVIQSSYKDANGHGRFDVVVLEGKNLVHYWSDSTANPPWRRGQVITANAVSAGCMIQSDYRNFEVVVCEDTGFGPPFELVHYYYDGSAWNRGPVITSTATGAGCLIQSNMRDGAHGNFEVIVPEGNALVHYWRNNGDPTQPWRQGQVITAKATGPACLIQSSFGKTGSYYGNFEVAALEGNRLVHYWNTNNDRFLFAQQYLPTNNVKDPYPVEEVDFRYTGAYSIYNWELFFYAPLLIATRLSVNQRFQDAMRWFHYIFNPTDGTPNEVPPARYWKFVPFKSVPQERLMDMIMKLDAGDPDLVNQVENWRHHPFQPFSIARLRLSAFQKNVFMKYLDNLIAWGDQLFQRDTIESINQAEQLYIMASHLLGPRPQTLPDRGKAPPLSYADLSGKLDAFSNALVLLENEFPFSSGVTTDPGSESDGLLGVTKSLYFCVPQNDKLLGYWDTVADRLFKIRHCMNIQGVVQRLPLFEPPIDPALLVQALAQGLDLGSILNDINAPLPYYRFTYTLQKALEMCAECRSLGGALLSALEKSDAEALAVLHAIQETNIQTLMKQIKSSQLAEAQDQVQALQKSRDVAVTRYLYYQTLLTGTPPPVPAPGADIPPAPIPSQPTLAVDGSGTRLLQEEQSELDSSHSARDWQVRSSFLETLASALHLVPYLNIKTAPLGVGLGIGYGGEHLGSATSAVARYIQNLSAQDSYDASHAGKMAGYFRRQQEWTLQSNLAGGEIMQIDQQITATSVRASMAQYELEQLYPAQLQNAQAVEDFLKNKYTNQELYTWLISDISATYFQCYQMAYDLAKKAERAFRFERGVTDSNFIQFGYWNSLRKGLQSGERLYLALKQMERAFHEQNKREYEITRRISLVLLDPLALIALKETGQCLVDLPELLFDTDYCGHYMRRIRNVSLTIPCVTGPYTSVNCTLTLLKSKIRMDPSLQSGYPEQDNDRRFVYNFAATQSIATSTGQNDSGMFEVNFRDERYLPFEGAGAVSQWRLEMPRDNNAFDFGTITDVIINLSYTARDGGDMLRQKARSAIGTATPRDALRMFSLKHEFSTEWYRFFHPADGASSQVMSLDFTWDRFPLSFRGKQITITKVELFLIFRDIYDPATYQYKTPLGDYAKGQSLELKLNPPGNSSSPPMGTLQVDPSYNGVPHALIDLTTGPPAGLWQLVAEDDEIEPIAGSLRTKLTTNGKDHYRLKVDVIDDIVAVCHCSVLDGL